MPEPFAAVSMVPMAASLSPCLGVTIDTSAPVFTRKMSPVALSMT